jgi:hypothetical protein
MLKYFTVLLLTLSPPVTACEALYSEGLTETQVGILNQAYDYGKPYGWGQTLAAIAWKESGGGKFLINLQDPSVGVFHVNVTKVVKHLGYKDTPFNRNRAAQVAMEEFEVSAHIAVMELAYWSVKRGRTWRQTVASYNAGTRWKNGVKYADDIAVKVEVLKKCRW